FGFLSPHRNLDANGGTVARRAFNDAGPAERPHSLGHGGEAKALRRCGSDAFTVIADGQAQHGGIAPRPVAAMFSLFGKVDGEVARISVADGVCNPFLDDAIEREVDRLPIGFGKSDSRIENVRAWVTALETG